MTSKIVSLIMPWPPSVNTYWRHPIKGRLAGRHLISKKGREYRSVVAAVVYEQRPQLGLDGRLAMTITAYPPDRRRRDLDNLLKATLDGLQNAGVYLDDHQIDDLRIVRGGVECGGRLEIEITEQVGA